MFIKCICTDNFQHAGQSFAAGQTHTFSLPVAQGLQAAGLVRQFRAAERSDSDRETIVCIASGPSLTAEDCAAAQRLQAQGVCRVITVNASFRAAPWADWLWGMDDCFWSAYGGEIAATFKGRRCAPILVDGAEIRDIKAGNSGAGAILLAAQLGAKRVILLGYDCAHTGGRAHWHPDHPAGLGNAGMVGRWPAQFAEVARMLPADCHVVNATRETALTQWPRMPLDDAINYGVSSLIMHSMQGMGDNFHQRAIVRDFMRDNIVYIDSAWPEIYHDLKGPRCRVVKPNTSLRTQAKNARLSRDFDNVTLPATQYAVDVRYPPDAVRKYRGVLPAMAAQCGVPDARDFAMPVPDEWVHGLTLPTDRPIFAYRPLVERKEWTGCKARNPDAETYTRVFRELAAQYGAYVVSVADVVPGKEWIVSEPVGADVELHAGELDIKGLCALWRDATMIYCAPGFGLVMAQALGRPVISLFGGYERAYSFRDDALTCKVEADAPCDCFTHAHGCGRTLNYERAMAQIGEWIDGKF